jgi:hypothetical protein
MFFVAGGDPGKFNELKQLTFWRFLFMWDEKLRMIDQQKRNMPKKK